MADDNRVFRSISSRIKHSQEQRYAQIRDWYCALPQERRAEFRTWVDQLSIINKQSPAHAAVRVHIELADEPVNESPTLLKLAFQCWDKGKPFIVSSIRAR